MNNLPPMLQDRDFMAMRSDILDAAQREPLTKEQIEAAKKPAEMILWRISGTGDDVVWEQMPPARNILTQKQIMDEYRKVMQSAQLLIEGWNHSS